MERMVETVDDIHQSVVMSGCCRAIVTIREFPSKMKEDNPSKIAKRAARKAAVASPARVEQGGLIREIQPMMVPAEFRQTAT